MVTAGESDTEESKNRAIRGHWKIVLVILAAAIVAAAIVVTVLGYGYVSQSSKIEIDFYDDGSMSGFGISYVLYDNGRKVGTGYIAMSSAPVQGNVTWPVEPGTHEISFDYIFSSDGQQHWSELDGQTDWSDSVYVPPHTTSRVAVSWHDLFLQQSD
jgi:hypothetical protein